MCSRPQKVCLPTATAFCDYLLLPVLQYLSEDGARRRVPHNGSWGNGQNNVTARPARFVRAHSVLAAVSDPAVAVRVVEERCEIAIAPDDDIPSASAVPTVGTAHWSAKLAAEGRAARSTGARLNLYDHAINEHHCSRVMERALQMSTTMAASDRRNARDQRLYCVIPVIKRSARAPVSLRFLWLRRC